MSGVETIFFSTRFNDRETASEDLSEDTYETKNSTIKWTHTKYIHTFNSRVNILRSDTVKLRGTSKSFRVLSTRKPYSL